jgi:hypothetical protein
MKNPRQSSRCLGIRSFGSFGARPILKATQGGIFRKPKAERIYNYSLRRDTEGR